jgi:micrococcal nuclease
LRLQQDVDGFATTDVVGCIMRHERFPAHPGSKRLHFPRGGRRRRRRRSPFTERLAILLVAGAAIAGWRMADALPAMGVAEMAEIASIAEIPAAPVPSGGEAVSGVRFGLCHSGGGRNCVVDGDTFWLAGEKIRIADIDTPETHPPRCEAEAAKGAAATRRLHALLNVGPFTLASIGRDTDRYGRKLRVVTRGEQSIGAQLVREGLARPYTGGRRAGWC